MKEYDFLKKNGWYQWYNQDYWCHEMFSKNGQRDETYYGMTTKDAVEYQKSIIISIDSY